MSCVEILPVRLEKRIYLLNKMLCDLSELFRRLMLRNYLWAPVDLLLTLLKAAVEFPLAQKTAGFCRIPDQGRSQATTNLRTPWFFFCACPCPGVSIVYIQACETVCFPWRSEWSPCNRRNDWEHWAVLTYASILFCQYNVNYWKYRNTPSGSVMKGLAFSTVPLRNHQASTFK